MQLRKFIYILTCFATAAGSISCRPKEHIVDPHLQSFEIVGTFVHDTNAYTQGLEFDDKRLLESSGISKKSWLALVDLTTGIHSKKINFDTAFAEGITILDNKIYQLTYDSKKIYVFDKYTFKLLKEVPIDHIGWGLCNNGSEIILTNGDNVLRYMDTTDFKIYKEVAVFENNKPLPFINEMEYIDGHIFANIYTTNFIYVLNAKTGQVIAKFDLGQLQKHAQSEYPKSEVLNGIAHIQNSDDILVTGKFWPKYYQLRYDKSKFIAP